MRFLVKHHQYKEQPYLEALLAAGHVQSKQADICLIDFELPHEPYFPFIQYARQIGAKLIAYPHGLGLVSQVTDGGGGQTDTYTPADTLPWADSTNFPCRIDVLSGTEGQAANRVSDRSTHVVTLNTGGTIAISLDDDLQIQNRGRYEITAIREHTSEFSRQFEVTDRIT